MEKGKVQKLHGKQLIVFKLLLKSLGGLPAKAFLIASILKNVPFAIEFLKNCTLLNKMFHGFGSFVPLRDTGNMLTFSS